MQIFLTNSTKRSVIFDFQKVELSCKIQRPVPIFPFTREHSITKRKKEEIRKKEGKKERKLVPMSMSQHASIE